MTTPPPSQHLSTTTTSNSTPSSPFHSSRQSNSPNTSAINLQPTYLEGETPNVFTDRMLGLHSKAPQRPGMEGKRGESLLDILSNTTAKGRKARGEEEEEEEEEQVPFLNENDRLGDENGINTSEGEEDGDDAVPGVRTERSRSKSQRRKLPWYKRPSPMFFLPSTLAMSLSIGMIIAPKLEIYNQLICRNIGPERSGTTLPAPATSILDHEALGSRRKPSLQNKSSSSSSEFAFDDSEQGNDLVIEYVEGSVVTFEDSWSKQCRRSPAVQASVAELATILTLLMGVLSALTAGYWGALSDRRGRKPILALSLFGTIFMDAVFLIVVNYHDVVGYKFLLVGPLLDGLLGGMSTAQAAVNAYLSDCTEAGSRARIFSILGGLLFGGIALGPTVGAISIQLSGSVMFPFYLALTLHTLYFFSVVFLFPESLSVARQLDARKRHEDETTIRSETAILEDLEAQKKGIIAVILTRGKRFVRMLFGFTRPLALLLPKKRVIGGGKEEDRSVLESRGPVAESGWDYELTKVTLAYAIYVIVIAIMAPKLMYAGYKFGWGAEENGFYLSFLGSCRVFALIIAIPLFIKFFRGDPPLPSKARPENSRRNSNIGGTTTFDSTSTSGSDKRLTKSQREWESEAKYLRVVHDSHFDLFLARISIMVDIFTYIIISTNGGSQVQFLLGSGLSSFGAGTTPALQSLALALTSPRDSGRLFASLSVLGSISSQVIGPIFFASIYIGTVKTFPEIMFYCATIIFILSLGITLSVNLKRKIVDGEALVVGVESSDSVAVAAAGGEEGQDGGELSAGIFRGRSITRKAATASEAGGSGIIIRD